MLYNGIETALAACGMLALVAASLAGGPPCEGGSCAHAVCRPSIQKKPVVDRVYDETSELICVTRPLGYLFNRRCDFSRIITKKHLILKIRRSEKYVPVLQAAPSGCSGIPPARVPALLPPTKPLGKQGTDGTANSRARP